MRDLCKIFIISTFIVFIIGFVFCLTNINKNRENEIYDNGQFLVIRQECLKEGTRNVYTIVSITVDKETGIMYIDGKPMYNTDGSFKIYDGEY